MVRWYDCLAAVLMADLMFSTFINSMMAESVWMNIFGGMVLVVLYDLWMFYCVMRKINEERKR